MIFGLCGTHGTGKSTILSGVEAAGWRVDRTQLSRHAQAALGWDRLSRAQESADNMWQLQEAILAAMYDRDHAIMRAEQATVVERTPVDVLAYTHMWCERLQIDPKNSRLLEYKGRVRELAKNYSQHMLVQPCAAVPFEEHTARADLKSRASVAANIAAFLWDSGLPHYIFKTTQPQTRVAEACAVLAMHGIARARPGDNHEQ